MATTLRRIGDPTREVALDGLEPGDCFRFDTLEGRWVYGHVVFANPSRVRALLYDYQGPAFDHADDRVSGRDRELNLPVGMRVERVVGSEMVTGAGSTAATGLEETRMAGVDPMKAAGLVAKYNHQQRQLAGARQAGDAGKAEVAEGRIKALEREAAAVGVELPVWEQNASGPGDKVEMKGVHKNELGLDEERFVAAQERAKGPILGPDERRALAKAAAAKKAADKAATPREKHAALAKSPKAAKERAMKKTHDCLCGCARETQSLYAPGHDARVKGILLKIERGELPLDMVPETVRPFVKWRGKYGTDGFELVAAPVRVPNRPEVENMSLQALEALDV